MVGVPHGPAVPNEQGAADQLQAGEDGGCLLQQDDETEHGKAGVNAETQTVAKRTHDALATSTDHGVSKHHHQTGAWGHRTEGEHGARRQQHVPCDGLHAWPKRSTHSTLTVRFTGGRG